MPVLELFLAMCLVADVFVIWAAFRGREDGEEPRDPGDGGTGRRRPPRTPPPEPSVSWSDFERQFAEYVAYCGFLSPVPAAENE